MKPFILGLVVTLGVSTAFAGGSGDVGNANQPTAKDASIAFTRLVQLMENLKKCTYDVGNCWNLDSSILDQAYRPALTMQFNSLFQNDRNSQSNELAIIANAEKIAKDGILSAQREDSRELYRKMEAKVLELRQNALNDAKDYISLDESNSFMNEFDSLQSAILQTQTGNAADNAQNLQNYLRSINFYGNRIFNQLRAQAPSVVRDRRIYAGGFSYDIATLPYVDLFKKVLINFNADESCEVLHYVTPDGEGITLPLTAQNIQFIYGGATADQAPLKVTCREARFLQSPKLVIDVPQRKMQLVYATHTASNNRGYFTVTTFSRDMEGQINKAFSATGGISSR